MKITQEEEVVDRQTVLHIELEDDDLAKYLDRGYRRVVQRTLIPGFRKGKAPRQIVEQYLGRESLLNEVLDSMLPEVTGLAITEKELDVVGLPRIELLDMDPVTINATVPLTPEVRLGAYGDITVVQDDVEVTEDQVGDRLEQLQHNMATWEPVDRPARMGDMVTAETVGTVEGAAFLDREDLVLFLDEDGIAPIPGFAQHVVDLGTDERKEFDLVVPEGFQDAALAGKEAHFSVELSEIKERLLPELDDEFAKSVGDGYENLEALRQEVEKDLKAEAESNADQQSRETVMKALLEETTIELPPLIVEHEIDHMEDQRARILGRLSIREDDHLRSIGKTAEDLRDEMREQAIERLNRTFALNKVSEAEGLEVSDEELDEKIASMMAGSEAPVADQPVSNEVRESIRGRLVADKTMDRLVSIAKGETTARSGAAQDEATESPDAEEGERSDDAEA